MAWNHVLCDGQPECPGRVILSLGNGHSSLVVYSEVDSVIRTFPCSVAALLGVQRGTRTHLASNAGECVLSKEADAIHIRLHTIHADDLEFLVPADDFLIALTKLVEAKAVQRKVSLQ